VAKRDALLLNSFVSAALVIVTALGVVLGGHLIERRFLQAERENTREHVRQEAFELASALQREVSHHQFSANAVANAVAAMPNLTQLDFTDMVRRFMQNSPSLINVAAAPDLVVSYVYPPAPNSTVIGLDYRKVPDQWPAVEAAIESRRLVFTGPVDLVQGGQGLITRAPVFVADRDDGHDRLWGVVSLVSGLPEMMRSARFSQQDDLRVAVRNVDLHGARHQVFWGDPAVFDEDPVLQRATFRQGAWEIGVLPAGGWPTASAWRQDIWAAAAALGCLLLIVIFLFRRIIQEKQRTWRQLGEAIEALDDGFALYDAEDRLILANQKYKSFYNASAHLMQEGATFESIIRGGVANGQYRDAIGREEEWIRERLAAHANPERPVEQQLCDGRWLKVSEKKLPDGSTAGFRVDVTELKRAQQAAEKANLAKTDFLNTVSHELRTPLSAVLGYASILSKLEALPAYRDLSTAVTAQNAPEGGRKAFDGLVTAVKSAAARIDRNGQHLLNIINDILYWTSTRSDNRAPANERVALDKLLNSVVEQLSVIADEKGIELQSAPAGGHVWGDEVRLRQVLLNIVGNALKFTSDGTVKVYSELADGELRIIVEDTGTGIAEHELEEIFEPFKQADTTITREHGGSGLGLPISRDIIHNHGGRIEVESMLGLGSRFVIILPAADEMTLVA
jgi:signal transduction histidine kinase